MLRLQLNIAFLLMDVFQGHIIQERERLSRKLTMILFNYFALIKIVEE